MPTGLSVSLVPLQTILTLESVGILLVSCCCSNKYATIQWLKTTNMACLKVLEAKSEISFSGLNKHIDGGIISSGACGGETISLPFPTVVAV